MRPRRGEPRTDSERDGVIDATPFRLLNNVWHPQLPADAGAQTIRAQGGRHGLRVGWEWDWQPREDDPVPASYPSLVLGRKPWDPSPAAPGTSLPVELGEIRSLTVRWQPHLDASGRYNLAIETWLCRPGHIDADGIRHEVMVWLGHAGPVQPIGRAVLSGDGYALWHGDGRHWKVSTFVLSAPPRHGIVDLHALLRRLVLMKLVDPGLIVADLEFGTEIWDGSGSLSCHLPRVELVSR